MDVLKTVCDILKTGMRLNDNQIWIYNQKIDIPTNNNFYIVVSLRNENVVGNNIVTTTGTKEKIYSNIVSEIGIEIFSNNTRALQRRYEVLSSMRSVYSLQKQEELSCNIGRKPTVFMDTSFLSPTSRLYSFYFQYKITHLEISDENNVEYYSDFSNANMSNTDNIKTN